MGFINSLLGFILIPLFISLYGGATSISAYMMTVISVVIIDYIILIPYSFGVKEPDDMKQLRLKLDVEEKKSSSSVKEVVIRVFKDRNWMVCTISFLVFAVGGYSVLAGINFYVLHGLGEPISAVIIPQLGMLAMTVVASAAMENTVR